MFKNLLKNQRIFIKPAGISTLWCLFIGIALSACSSEPTTQSHHGTVDVKLVAGEAIGPKLNGSRLKLVSISLRPKRALMRLERINFEPVQFEMREYEVWVVPGFSDFVSVRRLTGNFIEFLCTPYESDPKGDPAKLQ